LRVVSISYQLPTQRQDSSVRTLLIQEEEEEEEEEEVEGRKNVSV